MKNSSGLNLIVSGVLHGVWSEVEETLFKSLSFAPMASESGLCVSFVHGGSLPAGCAIHLIEALALRRDEWSEKARALLRAARESLANETGTLSPDEVAQRMDFDRLHDQFLEALDRERRPGGSLVTQPISAVGSYICNLPGYRVQRALDGEAQDAMVREQHGYRAAILERALQLWKSIPAGSCAVFYSLRGQELAPAYYGTAEECLQEYLRLKAVLLGRPQSAEEHGNGG